MAGFREDNEMSRKCTRARRLKLFTRKGRPGSGATRNCPPFHFRVVPRCAPTSGVPEISFFNIMHHGSLTELYAILNRVLITSSSDPPHSAIITLDLFFVAAFIFSNLVTSLYGRKRRRRKEGILHVDD